MSYVKTQWVNGDTITADKLNHIEAGIEANETENSLVKSHIDGINNSVMEVLMSTDVSENITENTQKYISTTFLAGKIYRLKITFTSTNMPRVRIYLSRATSINYRTDYIGEFYINSGDVLENIIIPTQDANYINITLYAGSGTQEFNVSLEGIPSIPLVDDSLSKSGEAADAKATGERIEKKTVVIDEEITRTYTEIPEINPVRVPIIYGFKKGLSYSIHLEAVNVNLDHTQTNQVILHSSEDVGVSVSHLVDALLSTGNHDVVSGDEWTIEYTPTSNDIKSLLLRFKTSTGSQVFDVTITEIKTVHYTLNAIDALNDAIAEISNQLPTRSRMQMGAHRGAEYFAPPNCVAAYEIAGKMGFPWAWLAQVRWSANNTLYVMHDEDVSITTNGTGNLSELTDTYIQSLLCNKIDQYDYSQFTEADLRVPTLEKVIQICLRYGMKMCFRIEPFPNNMDTERNTAIWNNFTNLIKGYGISSEWASYSAYNSLTMVLCRNLLGDVEICPFLGNSVTAQGYVDWFTDHASFADAKKAVLIPAASVTLADVKLLHTNGIKLYAFTNSSSPTQEMMEQFATWGVDILQNPRYARIPIVSQ